MEYRKFLAKTFPSKYSESRAKEAEEEYDEDDDSDESEYVPKKKSKKEKKPMTLAQRRKLARLGQLPRLEMEAAMRREKEKMQKEFKKSLAESEMTKRNLERERKKTISKSENLDITSNKTRKVY